MKISDTARTVMKGTGRSSESGRWIQDAYLRMFEHFGDPLWWPADTPFEVALGAILTQNTSWANVEKALLQVKEENLLHVEGLYSLPVADLAELIRPAGYYNVKARRVRAFLRFLLERYGGSMEEMFREDTEVLRGRLLTVSGIGPETADSILLYGDNRPVFVVDAYTRRILERHGHAHAGAAYEKVQQMFISSLPRDGLLYNRYHALIVCTGKGFCKKRSHCRGCPLEGL